MSGAVPSRAALRHLHRICNESCLTAHSRTASRSTATAASRQSPSTISRRGLRADVNISLSCQRRASTAASPAPPASTSPLPDITNHYTLFSSTLPSGPPPSGPFSIPLPSLRREFLSTQSLHHPDKHPTEPAHSKALALSSLINTAYRTLSDPLLRAQYLLLHFHDIDVMSEDNSAYKSDSDTLLEVMDAQERIEDAGGAAEVAEIKAENDARLEETVRKLGDAFERADVPAAVREVVRLKYWRSLDDGLKEWEPGKEVRLIH